MARPNRGNDWGFPRWRPYGSAQAATAQRSCDRDGCDAPGLHPAPKAPHSPERWYFCATHAADYNQRWDYFAGLDAEAAAERARANTRDANGYTRAAHWSWGEGDGTRTRAELDALRVLELDADADEAAVKAAHRRLAKANHPDLNASDKAAATRFHAVQAAYEVLERAAGR